MTSSPILVTAAVLASATCPQSSFWPPWGIALRSWQSAVGGVTARGQKEAHGAPGVCLSFLRGWSDTRTLFFPLPYLPLF